MTTAAKEALNNDTCGCRLCGMVSLCECNKEPECVAGCKRYYGGEVRHHKDCPFYPESLSKIYDDMEAKYLTHPTAPEVDITNGLKKLEVVKLVLKAASEDVRPAAPHWHNDFLSMAVKRIEEVQSLITAATQKGK